MEIHFRSNKIRKECEQAQAVLKKHGTPRSDKIKRRLYELQAATCLEDLRDLPGPRLHQHVRLKGQAKATLSVDLDHPYRLLFEASETPEPTLPGGGVDWSSVTAVTITSIEAPMAKRACTPFEPDYAVIPGETLNETLEETGMSQTALAERTGLSRKTISGIVNGSEPITSDTAILLERVFRVPARFWINLQVNYDGAVARLKERKRLAQYSAWIKSSGIPVRELVKRQAIAPTKEPSATLTAVLSFYGVATPDEYDTIWESALKACDFRKSGKIHVVFGAVSAWLRLGELAAQSIPCRPFDKARLDTAVRTIRGQVTRNVAEYQHELRAVLADCGVALVFVPAVPGAPIFGATRWLTSEKAIVQMSLRGKDDGNFWFTLFHELGHILLHGKRDLFLEMNKGNATDKEEAADVFARNRLIPPHEYDTFIREHDGRPGWREGNARTVSLSQDNPLRNDAGAGDGAGRSNRACHRGERR